MAKTENDEEKTKKCALCCFPKRRAMPKHNKNSESLTIQTDNTTSKIVYSNPLPKDLNVGNAICIRGLILPSCIRFAVNLICGANQNQSRSVQLISPDIGLHLNPRLDRNYIVRNSLIKGNWGDEEISSIVKCNLERGKEFEINLFILSDEFFVFINGKHFCGYRFRVPLNLLETLEVLGDVEVHDVIYKKWTVYPEHPQGNISIDVSEGEVKVNRENQISIPCSAHLPQGFQLGWQLNIYGRVKLLPHSFYINLQDGTQLWPHPIIPMHLNPRFNTSSGENILVRNAWIDGRWGPEERTSVFQFSPGSSFSLAIRRAIDHFSVWVDGQLTGEFKFRAPVDKIDVVYIHGDVVINQIVLNGKYVDYQKQS